MTYMILVILIVVAAVVVLVRGTRAKGKMGINLRAVSCPRCGVELSRFRIPRSGRQFIWGGYTCAHCGCEIDKWGREILPR